MLKTTLKRLATALPDTIKKPLRTFRDQHRIARYRGDKYECPICNAKLKSFVPYGLKAGAVTEKKVIGCGHRDNVHCPVCWVNDRDRLIYKFVTASPFLAPPNATILHVAPEYILLKYFKKRSDLNYITADYIRPTNVRLDILDLPFADNSFDLVICNHVLEHVADDGVAMREFHRIMKPNSNAILQVPIALKLDKTYEDPSIVDPRARELAFLQDDHVRLFGRDYPTRLENAGFEVTIIRWRERPDLFGVNAEKFGYNPDEAIYMVHKA